jgi:hypothetical protein
MPPRRSIELPDTIPENNGPKTKAELRQEALDGVLQIGQFIALAFGQFADAGAIGLHGQPMADEAVKLAENDSRVAAKVDLLIQVGPYAGFITAAIPLLAQLLVNHKLLKAEQFANAGVVTPETLASKMKSDLMKKAMDAMMEQKRIEEEMREMEEQMRANMNGQFEGDVPNTDE